MIAETNNWEKLRERYRLMTDFGLVDAYLQNGLEEEPKAILEEELQRRALPLDRLDANYREKLADELDPERRVCVDTFLTASERKKKFKRDVKSKAIEIILALFFRLIFGGG